MGADSSKHQVFGGNLSELYDADATQPVPFIINVCLKYLAHVKLQHELEMTGLEKALVSVGFVNEDDTPRSAVQTPLRQIRHGTGGIPSRTNSVASPSLRALHRKTSKTMSLVRPHKKLRTLLRLTKKSLNQGRVWPLLELLHPGPLEFTQVVPPAKLKDLKAKENIPSVEESCRLVMLVLCDFLKELAEPLWNEEFTRQFQECIFDGNSRRMFQLYSVQRTAHKAMSDALLSSLHEFWMQNSEYVTGDMLCAIFGPSCAQTKLISDPKGPVVYLNAEAGETAQQVFQYILERAVAFVNDARPVDAEGGPVQTIVVEDEAAKQELEAVRAEKAAQEALAREREQHLQRKISGTQEAAAAAKKRYRDKVVGIWMNWKATANGPDLRAHFHAWASVARQAYRAKSRAMIDEFREEFELALNERDKLREQVDDLRAELEDQKLREERWAVEKQEFEALFFQQRQEMKQLRAHQKGVGNRGSTTSGRDVNQQSGSDSISGSHGGQDQSPQQRRSNEPTGSAREAGSSSSAWPRHSHFHGEDARGVGGRHTARSEFYGGGQHAQGEAAARSLSDAELIARLRLHDREIYRQIQEKYFGGSTGVPTTGVAFGANLSTSRPPAQNSYYWPVGRDR